MINRTVSAMGCVLAVVAIGLSSVYAEPALPTRARPDGKEADMLKNSK